MTRATYVSWFDARKTPQPEPWDLGASAGPVPNHAYLAETFRLVEAAIEERDPQLAQRLDRVSVVVTPNPEELPLSGPGVVGLLVFDNWARVPRWADDVALLLATNRGRRFSDGARLLPRPIGVADVVDEARVRIERTRWLYRGRRPSLSSSAIVPMPLGYAHQRDVPPVPWEERDVDAYFAGSTVHVLDRGGALRRRLRASGLGVKSLHRQQMLAAAERLRRERPDLNVKIDLVTSDSVGDHADDYSTTMARTRFSLDPRGQSRESYRFFEAARVGTIPVVTALPMGGLYAGAPALRLKDWSQLPAAMRRMTDHPEEARALHEAVLDWYARQGSPEGTARRLVPLFEDVLRRMP